jgi:hypothetical protein
MKKRTIKRALRLAGAALLIASATSAHSGNLEKAARILEQQARAGRGEFITYLVGAATAYRWVSSDNDVEKPALYCPPSDTRLDGRAWGKIALEEYRRDKTQYARLDEYPLSVFALALLHGLQSRFPCPPSAARAPGSPVDSADAPAATASRNR